MVDHQNRYVIVFNGEVYNFKQLRNEIEQSEALLTSHSDTEAILEGYKIWGSDILTN